MTKKEFQTIEKQLRQNLCELNRGQKENLGLPDNSSFLQTIHIDEFKISEVGISEKERITSVRKQNINTQQQRDEIEKEKMKRIDHVTKEEAKKCFLKLKHATKLEKLILFFKILNTISHAQYEVLDSFIYKKIYDDNEGERMSAIFVYSMKNFAREIDLNQIAAIAFMTPNSFCRYFKQRTNITYFQFLIKIRIEHACTLLSSHSDIAVAEIAVRSGFKNISNFNRQFKSIKKLSPLKYKSIDQV